MALYQQAHKILLAIKKNGEEDVELEVSLYFYNEKKKRNYIL